MVNNPLANAEDAWVIFWLDPWVRRRVCSIPGEGIGNPLQYPCWGNPIDGGAWLAKDMEGCKELDLTATEHARMQKVAEVITAVTTNMTVVRGMAGKVLAVIKIGSAGLNEFC